MKRLLAVACVLGAAACTGLYLDRGNDFPCDFRAPEAERDKACTPGEVCGVDNVCRPFHYEGPQFEGRARLPRLDAGLRIHPGSLEGDVRAVALNGKRDGAAGEATLLVVTEGTAGARAWFVDRSLSVATVVDAGIPPGPLDELRAAAHVSRTRTALVRKQLASRTLTQQFQAGAAQDVTRLGGGPLLDVRDLRTGQGTALALTGSPAGFGVGSISAADKYRDLSTLVRLDDGGLADGGTFPVFDVALVNPKAFDRGTGGDPAAVALTPSGLMVQAPSLAPEDGEWMSLHSDPLDATELAGVGGPLSRLKTDPTGRLLAVAGGGGSAVSPQFPRKILSTWSLVRSGPGSFTVARPWPDCSPCGAGIIVGHAPSLDGRTSVEVMCAGTRGQLSAVRVIGSTVSDPTQACSTEALALPWEISRARTTGTRLDTVSFDAGTELVQDNSVSWGVAVGATFGRVYVGPTFSSALPIFLDRLPLSAGNFPAVDGGFVLAALTDRFAAARLSEQGFQMIDLTRAAQVSLDGVTPAALVGEAPGWVVLSTGDLLRSGFTSVAGTLKLAAQFGPRLLDTKEAPATGPFIAEAVPEDDGGVRALVLTAFDSVYLSRDDLQGTLTDSPNSTAPLRPQLTPEPTSPIRSFALERSVLGTDGRSRVRGYLATARSLYLIQYGGTPARWSATPLVLTAESPVEVWMDHPRGGLGRAGYPSGEVYTLPGAFLLSRSLEASGALEGVDAGVQVSIDDYENLAGWPVAYSRAGVFVADYDLLPDGGLDNKQADGRLGKPMTWKRVRLGDGREPWLGKPGRLHVRRGPRLTVGPAYEEEWTLIVFTADEAYEAAFATRSNAR